MKRNKLLICTVAMLLLFSMLLCACSDATPGGEDETTEKQEEDLGRLPDSLPDDLKLNDTLTVWYFTQGDDPSSESFVDLAGDVSSGDNVAKAMYERNLAIEDQLAVDMVFINADVTSGGVGSAVRKVIMSDSTEFDVFNVIQWNSAILAVENCFLEISDTKYLDLEQPWWSQNYMQNLALGNNMYFMAGDVSIDLIRCSAAMYYNKDIYGDSFGEAEGLYEKVANNEWTMDYMMSCMETAYVDLNNNSKADSGDRLGLVSNTYNNVDALTFGAGAVISRRDENNMPYLTGGEEHNIDVYNKTYQMFYETSGVMTGDPKDIIPEFIAGNALFMPGFLYTSEFLRDIDNYGIVPMPKYDAEQDEYVSAVHDLTTLFCLPANCTKVDTASAVLEALAYYSYYEVTPVYYESAMKSKYVQDSQSAQMVDIIHDTSMTDFSYVYSGSINNAGMIMRELIAGRGQNYSSTWSKREKSANKALNNFLESFE